MANASRSPAISPPASLAEHRRFCPRCGNLDVRLSQHPLPLMSLFGLETWRCRACRRRFLVEKLVEDEEGA